jgi:phosphoribosylaminoimidazolecarboxamide formyltransferase/IMP cyclohydrolase
MLRTIRRALVSVSDKSGLLDLAQGLHALGVVLISTGGTRQALTAGGLPVTDISTLTGFPEILDGRVKTLHPRVHAGILAKRDDAQHTATLTQQQIEPIDLVVCNLYPFETVAAKPGVAWSEVVENIDVGGPSMLRAAAKNYADVAVLSDPSQYDAFLAELRTHNGACKLGTRQSLAAVAFARTAGYDAAIAAAFSRQAEPEQPAAFPTHLNLRFERTRSLRYGENPHQLAAFYAEPGVNRPCVTSAEVLHGKELSYNNLLDLDSALNLVREFTAPTTAIIKHNNPCGAATADTLAESFQRAYEADPLSAFGGIIAVNHELDEATALATTEPGRFVECIIAPRYSARAVEVLTTRPTWKASVRLLRTGPLESAAPSGLDFRRVDGGLLVQARDAGADDPTAWRVVTRRAPTPNEWADLRFAWLVCKHVKSNAIVLGRAGRVVGVGAGQMSRVDSVQIATRKAGPAATGAALASDAFFPFRDNVDVAAQAGVTAVIQPGGSKKDADSIAACDELGLAMVFTGVRHFRH